MNLCIIQTSEMSLTETFIRAHIDLIPAHVTAVHGKPARIGDREILSDSLWSRAMREVRRNQHDVSDNQIAYERILRRVNADAVLAEYGVSGVEVMPVCRKLGIPLIVHFHGFDACRDDVLSKMTSAYSAMFDFASAIIAVSRVMREQLISLGAPEEKVFYNPCGVDCDAFEQGNPAANPPVFLGVGRFVQKKAPHLLLHAFSEVNRQHPDAELRLIGDGPLLGVCRDLATVLGIDESVQFLGSQPHNVVREEMLGARAFVQHSVVADDGDSEGTPVSVMEAGASGLPVVSTLHAGIPLVVVHNETGFLVEERDVEGMAEYMIRLLDQPTTASVFGAAARERIQKYFRMERSIGRLSAVIESCVGTGDPPPLDYFANGTQARRTAHSVV